jgi:GMP synthase (glutamine-hydrolysing)
LPKSFEAFHFHAEMSGLPMGSVVLAESAGCPRQIVRFARLAYGLQCHLEVDFESAILMGKDLPDFDFSSTHRLLHLFLDSLIKRAS